ncbi:hypothetical protein NUU61_001602 [Penicillium alfredii]|uniref:Ankyrin n=1 Tax=Penicillium alfredii TaxID=1506179 RepID=A0A9W9G2C0_9EURO|nr:uncharacterized protein NUU61_001602 [Penicillium alfredii]KAJ5110345.1 hypothetical protein NUU61_001602 [Penicillium alfredii]
MNPPWADPSLNTLPNALIEMVLINVLCSDPPATHTDLHALRTLITMPGHARFGGVCIALLGNKHWHNKICKLQQLKGDSNATALNENPSASRGTDVDAASDSIFAKCFACVDFLLQTKAILPTMYISGDRSLLLCAMATCDTEIEGLFVDALDAQYLRRPLLGTSDPDETYLAIRAGDPIRFPRAWQKLEADTTLDLIGWLRPTDLFEICKHATPELMDRLLTRGITLADVDEDGRGCWHALIAYHPDPVTVGPSLLCHDPDPSRPALRDGETPLMMAVRLRRVGIGKWLVKYSNTRAKNHQQQTVAQQATKQHTSDSVEILEEIMRATPLDSPADIQFALGVIKCLIQELGRLWSKVPHDIFFECHQAWEDQAVLMTAVLRAGSKWHWLQNQLSREAEFASRCGFLRVKEMLKRAARGEMADDEIAE